MTTTADRLRLVLRANAGTSIAGGLTALLGAGFVSDRLGVDHVALTALVGVGLLLFAVDVLRTAADDDRMRRSTPWISVADLAWVAATVPVVASGVLSSAGDVVAVVVGLGVLDFAILQLVLWRRLASDAPERARDLVAA